MSVHSAAETFKSRNELCYPLARMTRETTSRVEEVSLMTKRDSSKCSLILSSKTARRQVVGIEMPQRSSATLSLITEMTAPPRGFRPVAVRS
jgi:hypothetical protein